MNFLPSASDTIVLGISAEKAIMQLKKNTRSEDDERSSFDGYIYFNGEVRKSSFSISLKITKPNSFIPIILGRLEPTSTGSLLFLNYTLFKSTKAYIIFWSLFTLITSVVSFFVSDGPWYAVGALGFLISIQWIAWANFNIQVKNSRSKLLEVLK